MVGKEKLEENKEERKAEQEEMPEAPLGKSSAPGHVCGSWPFAHSTSMVVVPAFSVVITIWRVGYEGCPGGLSLDSLARGLLTVRSSTSGELRRVASPGSV